MTGQRELLHSMEILFIFILLDECVHSFSTCLQHSGIALFGDFSTIVEIIIINLFNPILIG